MIFFVGIVLASFVGFCVLFLRHLSFVRSLSQNELEKFIHSTSALGEQFSKRATPLKTWCINRVSYFFYHIVEWVIKWMRWGLLIGEERLRVIGDYLHGRKIFFNKRRRSPFWESMHEWRNELKNSKDFPTRQKDKENNS